MKPPRGKEPILDRSVAVEVRHIARSCQSRCLGLENHPPFLSLFAAPVWAKERLITETREAIIGGAEIWGEQVCIGEEF